MLFVLLRRALGGLNEGRLLSSFVRIALASAVMGAVALLTDQWLSAVVPPPIPWQILQVAADIGAALGALAITALVLRIREFHDGMGMVLRRLRRRR